ncbi:hypothetical protein CHM34_05705 [Paludifilum halophilum]|uniref:SelT/SelW/SelH family protein n=1 Tax=Paludifilum halophilum TaxID=1642702 RepID=A0A235B7Q3_9BACL|nr:hypothetical protein CHM34_05705 [Paludifilum halophilum]
MAEEVFSEFRQQIEEMTLVPSGGGVFEVDLDGKRIFSKKQLNRHAEEKEIPKLIHDEIG